MTVVVSPLPPVEAERSGRPPWQERFLRLLRYLLITALALLALWLVAKVLLVIFAGILLAILLRALADWLARWTRLPPGLSLAIVVLAIILVAAGTGYFLAPRASDQLNQLFTRLPDEFHRLEDSLARTGWGKALVQDLQRQGSSSGAVVGRVFGAATTTVDVLAAIVIILFVGLYLAAEPRTYLAGALRLVPPTRRLRMAGVLWEVTEALRWWLVGRIISMAIITIMTATGLWLLGVQLALTLGLLAGILAFVPYVGSVTSAIPAILIALTQRTELALYVILLFVGVHVVEGYILVPLMQKRMVHLPPALTLGAQAVLGALFGVLGLALATPLVAAIVTATRLLYIEDVLHDNPAQPVLEAQP
jgi:predicted PurR-regulated permease PerM